QVWVCDTCGSKDHKSCSCDSAAYAEEVAAKRERNRQANRAHRARKARQKQQPRDDHANIGNIEDSPEEKASLARQTANKLKSISRSGSSSEAAATAQVIPLKSS